MNDHELLRYSRHILLNEIDIAGQERLLSSHALLVGVGGLGSPVGLYLAAAGVGRITLVDHDRVDLTNLQRQIVHMTDSLDQRKTTSAKQILQRINPHVEVIRVSQRATLQTLPALVHDVDIVLDCSDNFETRHTINTVCVTHRLPLVFGAAIQFEGQCSVFDVRDTQSPCYACLFPAGWEGSHVACATMGVFAPLVGMIGCLQAAEALKLLIGMAPSLKGYLWSLDARTMLSQSIRVRRDYACQVCGSKRPS